MIFFGSLVLLQFTCITFPFQQLYVTQRMVYLVRRGCTPCHGFVLPSSPLRARSMLPQTPTINSVDNRDPFLLFIYFLPMIYCTFVTGRSCQSLCQIIKNIIAINSAALLHRLTSCVVHFLVLY